MREEKKQIMIKYDYRETTEISIIRFLKIIHRQGDNNELFICK